MVKEEDIRFMERAIELAQRGRGRVNPNPLVGAVIVRDGRVIGEGWHEHYGGWHAERNALRNATEDVAGATMYVTLEPCSHYGKTPPCANAVILAGIRRVVVGMVDPNPLVAGKGIDLLRQVGVEVEVGVCEEKVRELNRVFLKYITTRHPWVVMKTAMTLDGKIAAASGDSKWVTGEESRRMAHELRSACMGILVGAGTVAADDPMLNCRLEGNYRQPVRIVVDTEANISLERRLVTTAHDYKTIVAYVEASDRMHLQRLEEQGVELMQCKAWEGKVDVWNLLEQLGRQGIDSLLLEGGSALNGTFLDRRLVDEVYAFIAPKLVGGAEAKTPIGGRGRQWMGDATVLRRMELQRVGEDILIHGFIN